MTAPTERIDGDAPDPRVIRVLLRYHEAVAQASERAYLELRDLGLGDNEITARLLGQPPKPVSA